MSLFFTIAELPDGALRLTYRDGGIEIYMRTTMPSGTLLWWHGQWYRKSSGASAKNP